MSEELESVLITGGLGQIGYNSYLKLKETYKVVIIDNLSNNKFEPPEEILFIEGDIADPSIYMQFPKIDYIIHCAAQISVTKSIEDPITDLEANILGTVLLLRFAKDNNVKKFVFLGSAAVYGNPEYLPLNEIHPRNPISPYGLSKLTSERYVSLYYQLFKLPTVTIIPFNVYSSYQNENDPNSNVLYKFITRIISNDELIIYGDGTQKRDFIHVEDVVEAIILALKTKNISGEIINIGTGKPTSINELVQLLSTLSIGDVKPKYIEEIPGEIKESYTSIEKAKKLIGFSPKISLEEGIKLIYKNLS